MADPALPATPEPGLGALLAELARSREAALARFPGLDAATQSALLIAAPAQQRMELLLVAPACAELIAMLPAPVIAQTVTACEDDADLLLRHASPAQIATAIDLDCRRQGRLRIGRFRRWIALLASTSGRDAAEAADALRGLDLDLLAAGLAPLVRMDRRAGAYVRIASAYGGAAPILLDDFDCDDEEVWAFLRLDEVAPERLAELGAALAARDEQELVNEDYAGYEARMATAGLRDWAQAAESMGAGGSEGARAPSAHDDAPEAGSAIAAAAGERRLLADALAALIAREDCDHQVLDRLAAEIARLSNDAIVASDAGSDEAAAKAARARVDELIARGLARTSGGDPARAASLLLRTPLEDILRAGRR